MKKKEKTIEKKKVVHLVVVVIPPHQLPPQLLSSTAPVAAAAPVLLCTGRRHRPSPPPHRLLSSSTRCASRHHPPVAPVAVVLQPLHWLLPQPPLLPRCSLTPPLHRPASRHQIWWHLACSPWTWWLVAEEVAEEGAGRRRLKKVARWPAAASHALC